VSKKINIFKQSSYQDLPMEMLKRKKVGLKRESSNMKSGSGLKKEFLPKGQFRQNFEST
jgi:hypothetical protein